MFLPHSATSVCTRHVKSPRSLSLNAGQGAACESPPCTLQLTTESSTIRVPKDLSCCVLVIVLYPVGSSRWMVRVMPWESLRGCDQMIQGQTWRALSQVIFVGNNRLGWISGSTVLCPLTRDHPILWTVSGRVTSSHWRSFKDETCPINTDFVEDRTEYNKEKCWSPLGPRSDT